jgi:hypothetical protein
MGWRCSRCEPCEAAERPRAVFDYRMPAPDGDPTRCRVCGGPMGWPGPVGITFADGTAAHHACDGALASERSPTKADRGASSETIGDLTDMTTRGELP